EEHLLQVHAARLRDRRRQRWQPRAARTPPAQVWAPEAGDCNTCKARSVRAYQRGGILCATFGCGVVMPPQRFHVAESLPQVAAYVEHLLRINPALRTIGYDDWCHLAPHLRSYGSVAAARLQGYVDRWHARGHRRPQCWSTYSPDRYKVMYDWEEHTVFSSATLQGLVASLVHGRQRWELHSWSGCIWGSARPTVRLHALLTYTLPLVLTFLSPQPAGRVLREARVRSEGGRTRVVEALRRLSVELQQPLRGSGWDVDAGFQLVGVASPTTGALVGGFPQNFLRSHLAAVTQFPLRILLRRPVDTSLKERQWRDLNRLGRSLRYCSPATFDVLLLRALNERNWWRNDESMREVLLASADFVRTSWDSTLFLGPEVAQAMEYEALFNTLHCLPTTLAHETLGLHAMNAVMVKIRFAHFKKTNKSGLNTIIEENAIPFELWLNHASLQGHVDGQLDRSEAPLTLTFIPGATPEELFAQCDADKVTRVYHGLLHGHDEIAGFFEDMGLYGGGQRTKARQSDLNVLMDKGRPSKIFRDQDRGYGKDLFALYRQTRDGTKPHKVQLLQISGINARDADRILRDDDVIAASLATRERYLFFTAPVMNPYALPPAHVQLPTEVLDEHGEPLQDRAGFRRDLLPRRGDCVQGMKRCYHFVHGLPNQELRFTDSGLEKFRCFDAWNWRLAGYVQYVDDQL
ncbi:Phosphoglycerate kinase, partial [Durusdinium trenchii]